MPKFTNEIIEAAISGFESQKQVIDLRIAELHAMLTGPPEASVAQTKRRRTRRKLSPEALERIREGQKRRWAAARGELSVATAKASKPKRKLSAAGRKAIVAALKKRWAAKRAAAA